MSFDTRFFTPSRAGFAAVALSTALLAAAPLPASAGVVLEQTPIINGGGVLSSGSFRSFDDFKLGTSTQVTAVRWWESNFNSGTQSFSISFLAGDWPNLPSLVPFYTTTVTATGTTAGAFTYEYDATLPVPVVLPANTNLWISIVDLSGGFYFWAAANGAPSPGSLPAGVMASVNSSNNLILQGIDAAWALISDPVAVPEPTSLALLAAGLAGAGLLRRRRSARQ